jgi:hypothetical protein
MARGDLIVQIQLTAILHSPLATRYPPPVRSYNRVCGKGQYELVLVKLEKWWKDHLVHRSHTRNAAPLRSV